ncbi:MAG: inositol monophosphatase, partial [Pseudomonadota bacterium]|nr:inositol monophosphatase [Pseudomonadota bacterium]
MESTCNPGISATLAATIAAVKKVAREEVMPRYLKVAHERKTDGSLFTQADIAAQNALRKELTAIRDCPLLGEEMKDDEHLELWKQGNEGIWCVDPIDGTSNFVNGIPYFAVSVALVQNHWPVLGVVYDPVAEEAFYAERGLGACLN